MIYILGILIFGGLCFLAGVLVGSRNHARVQADLDDAKDDIRLLRDDVAGLRGRLALPKPSPITASPAPAQMAAPTAPTKS